MSLEEVAPEGDVGDVGTAPPDGRLLLLGGELVRSSPASAYQLGFCFPEPDSWGTYEWRDGGWPPGGLTADVRRLLLDPAVDADEVARRDTG